nr:DExH-box ATP-dependent RNA helicase DExH12-like [Ipomoea batatas]
MGGGSQDDMIQEADEGMALNVQDIDAYWLRFLRSSDPRIGSLYLTVILSPHFIHPLPPSKLHTEATRCMGDTQEDLLLIPSDEEHEVVVWLPPKLEVSSPVNPDYDYDYQEFLAEFLAEETPVNTPPTPPQMVKPDTSFPLIPTTSPWIDPPSPPSPMSSVVTGDSPTGTTTST